MIPKTPIWIAPRTDSLPGAGTRLNPLNGSGADRFDRIMRERLRPDVRVHLIPWTGTNELAIFETTGSKSFNETLGYYVPLRCEIIGLGPDIITVRKIDHPETSGNAHGVFEMDYTSEGGTRIEGLTIDEGGQALAGKSTSTFAARLHGDNNTIKRVHAINGYGHRESGAEAFSLSLVSSCKNGVWQNNIAGVMDSLIVSNFAGDYGIAISALPSSDGLGSVKSVIKDCMVLNHHGTAPYGMCSHVKFQDCKTLNCFGGWYGEANAELTDVEIDGAKILKPAGGFGIHFNPIGQAGAFRRVLIERSTIEVCQVGIPISGSNGPGHQFDFTIRNNTFLRAANANNDPAGIVCAHVDGILVEGNRSDPELRYILNHPDYPSTNILCRGNGRLPAPYGLEDSP